MASPEEYRDSDSSDMWHDDDDDFGFDSSGSGDGDRKGDGGSGTEGEATTTASDSAHAVQLPSPIGNTNLNPGSVDAAAAPASADGRPGPRGRVLLQGQRLEKSLLGTKECLEEFAKNCRSDTRKTQAHVRELYALIGGAKPRVDPAARRQLTEDSSDGKLASSLRTEVDFFFRCSPPMDDRGKKLQEGVIDHRVVGFPKHACETLKTEVLNSVKKALCLHVKQKFGRNCEAGKHELERFGHFSSAQWLDEAERANICVKDPKCKVWHEVGQVMWRTSKKSARECCMQFLNECDPRLERNGEGLRASGAGAGNSQEGGTKRAAKRIVACDACAARKKKCTHTQPAIAAQEKEAVAGWPKREVQQMVERVKKKETWEAIASALKRDFGKHRSALEVMEHYQQTYNHTMLSEGRWSKDEDAVLTQVVAQCDEGDWVRVAQRAQEQGCKRNEQQCLHRWRFIDPKLKKGRFSAAEDKALMEAAQKYKSLCGDDRKGVSLAEAEGGESSSSAVKGTKDDGSEVDWDAVMKHMPHPRRRDQLKDRWRILRRTPPLAPQEEESGQLGLEDQGRVGPRMEGDTGVRIIKAAATPTRREAGGADDADASGGAASGARVAWSDGAIPLVLQERAPPATPREAAFCRLSVNTSSDGRPPSPPPPPPSPPQSDIPSNSSALGQGARRPPRKKKAWTEDEDQQLKELVCAHGSDWVAVAQGIAGRGRKECMQRFAKRYPEERKRAILEKEVEKKALPCGGRQLGSRLKKRAPYVFNLEDYDKGDLEKKRAMVEKEHEGKAEARKKLRSHEGQALPQPVEPPNEDEGETPLNGLLAPSSTEGRCGWVGTGLLGPQANF